MKICIDPGHGMSNRVPGRHDPGATHIEGSALHTESTIVLRYGLALKEALLQRGYEVFMTRDAETDPAPVGRRAAEAVDQGCDIFLSFHMNDVENDQANGTETLYRGARNLDFARRIQSAVLQPLGLRDRGPKERTDLAVLRFKGPAALIELGFIANDADRTRILSPSVRSETCKAIADELDRIRKVASSQTAQMDPAHDDRFEADDDITTASYYDTADPMFAAGSALAKPGLGKLVGKAAGLPAFDLAAFSGLVASWKLKHFVAAELLNLGSQHNGGGGCSGRNSLPPKELWPNMQKTARLADAIRDKFGNPIRVLSAYRNPSYNGCIGGASSSYHMQFIALDLANVGGTTAYMHKIAEELMEDADFAGGLGLYGARGFIHIDTRGTFTPF